MARMRFGAFLAPQHPVGEHPMLQFRRDLDFVEHVDRLGLDEFWCGEHHSSGWEMISSPEMFLAAAGERTARIMLGTGVVSLPYHHPFHVANRIAQLDHMTGGRAMFGSGPGALPSDARMLCIDPLTQRDRQDEALGVIIRLLRGERFDYKSEWFEMREAGLQILPLQEDLPMVTASSISPSGMKIAGKYGIGVLSLGSTSTEGLLALPTQWAFAAEAAAQHEQTVDRRNWRVIVTFHIAETAKQARDEAADGLARWHNGYNVRVLGRPGAKHFDDKYALVDAVSTTGVPGSGAAVIGTPDDLVARIRELQQVTGGFGVLVGFVHDWTSPEANLRSWDLFARHVVPEINGHLRAMRQSSQEYVDHQKELVDSAGAAIIAQIKRDPKAVEAFSITKAQGRQGTTTSTGASAAAGAALRDD